jgi:hypothetical protein
VRTVKVVSRSVGDLGGDEGRDSRSWPNAGERR